MPEMPRILELWTRAPAATQLRSVLGNKLSYRAVQPPGTNSHSDKGRLRAFSKQQRLVGVNNLDRCTHRFEALVRFVFALTKADR